MNSCERSSSGRKPPLEVRGSRSWSPIFFRVRNQWTFSWMKSSRIRGTKPGRRDSKHKQIDVELLLHIKFFFQRSDRQSWPCPLVYARQRRPKLLVVLFIRTGALRFFSAPRPIHGFWTFPMPRHWRVAWFNHAQLGVLAGSTPSARSVCKQEARRVLTYIIKGEINLAKILKKLGRSATAHSFRIGAVVTMLQLGSSPLFQERT